MTTTTINPAENIDQLRELRVMVGTLVGNMIRCEQNMARALNDTRYCLEDVDRGWGAANVAQHAARLGSEEAALEAVYESLKAVLEFARHLYGDDTAREVLAQVGGDRIEREAVKVYLAAAE